MLVGGYEAEPAARWIDGVPWDHAATALPPDYERFAPLLAGAALRFPFLGDAQVEPARVPPGCDDPGREPAARADARRSRVLGGGRPVAQRLRGRRRDRPGDGGLDHDGRPGRRRRAYRAWRFPDTYRDPDVRGGLDARGVRYYYRLRYPVRRRRGGPAAAALGGPRRGSRSRARYSASRRASSAPTTTEPGRAVAPGRAGPAGLGLGQAAVLRAARRGVPGGPRAGRAHRPVVVRQDRRRQGGARSALLQRVAANDVDRPVGSIDLHAVPRRARRDARGRHGDAPRGRPLPGRDRSRLRRRRPRLAAAQLSPTDAAGRRSATSPTRWPASGLWGPRARDVLGAVEPGRRSTTRPCRSGRPREIRDRRRAPVLASPDQLRGRARLGADDVAPWASQVWDASSRAGEAQGIEPFGYRALEALRLEKGYRYYGTDLTRARRRRGRPRRLRPAGQGPVHRPRCARSRVEPDGRRPAACGRSSRRRRVLPALRRRGGPGRRRDRRPAPQRGVRPHRRADGRDGLPASRDRGGDADRGRRVRRAGLRRSRRGCPGRSHRCPDARLSGRQSAAAGVEPVLERRRGELGLRPGPALDGPAPEVVVDRVIAGLDRGPQRPADVAT